MFIRYVQRFYLPVFCAVSFLVYLAQHYSFLSLPELVNNYLNDLLCMPIVLKLCQYGVRFVKRDKQLRIPVKMAFTLTALYAIYFEWVLPRYNPRYTADPIDMALYFLGLLFFLWIESSTPDRDSIKS